MQLVQPHEAADSATCAPSLVQMCVDSKWKDVNKVDQEVSALYKHAGSAGEPQAPGIASLGLPGPRCQTQRGAILIEMHLLQICQGHTHVCIHHFQDMLLQRQDVKMASEVVHMLHDCRCIWIRPIPDWSMTTWAADATTWAADAATWAADVATWKTDEIPR